MMIDGSPYTIISERDVVVVLQLISIIALRYTLSVYDTLRLNTGLFCCVHGKLFPF